MITLKPIIPKVTFDSQDFITFVYGLMNTSVKKMYNALKKYPGYKYVSWKSIGGFVSEKQRRFVMANIRKGIITIPYPRTQSLERSWKMNDSITSNEVIFTVGTDHPKAQYVESRPTQHKRMTTIRWQTVESVTETMWPKEQKRIESAVSKYKPK